MNPFGVECGLKCELRVQNTINSVFIIFNTRSRVPINFEWKSCPVFPWKADKRRVIRVSFDIPSKDKFERTRELQRGLHRLHLESVLSGRISDIIVILKVLTVENSRLAFSRRIFTILCFSFKWFNLQIEIWNWKQRLQFSITSRFQFHYHDFSFQHLKNWTDWTERYSVYWTELPYNKPGPYFRSKRSKF